MSQVEKIKIFEKWGSVKKDQMQIIAMLGGTCLKEMQELAQKSVSNQLDAIAILPPYYFRPSNVEHLIDFCQEVTKYAPELPFYYYHIPSLTGVYLSMFDFLEKAAPKIPNLAGIKFSHSDIMDFHSCKMFEDGKYTMLWGMDEALLSGLVVGADGAVGSTYNYAAPLYLEILENFSLGNIAECEALQRLSVKMVQILVKYGGNRAGKGFMKLIGVDCGGYRLPLVSLTDKEIAALRKDLEAINFFDFCSVVSDDKKNFVES
ncbi:MAG: dihydrodipicolinate synthase family protein [Saprospiraceae bacterium]|nr:dihydrodipicolinate synthase family protein [Saprospiraceae bacterium]